MPGHIDMGGSEHSQSRSTYADYELQQIGYETSAIGSDENVRTFHSHEPVRDRGLENDEVAELVAGVFFAQCSLDDFESNATQKPGSAEHKGTWGANLNFPETGAGDWVTEETNPTNGQNIATVSGGSTRFEQDEPGVFENFLCTAISPHQDTANQQAGGGSAETVQWSMNYRNMFGRGPILDASDELTLGVAVVRNETSFTAEGTFTARLVWDVSTVEDERKEFALPETA